ncbi:ABC transporter substrate-binding protein [Prosthecodimorpha staleyi]|uniref:ABC transporter substrate-binding protein n=1 Tax=Prosthecodimorpha staleyi TaxID=2840188 RepID=A0A947GH26_9HYPH|nr:ABC transporter substrate-binding protein [Prosthecodimorpha staleyi]MBT9293255.1 ABC transporter substrate-binding protein [Prosthecodimorpha staleyi]
MRVNTLLVGTAMMALVATALPAAAEDSLYIPLLTYRTGAFAGSGIPIADGMHDYFKMLNARDGGIGGVKIVTEECETGYTAQKGVECYEATKAKGALVYNPWSTGITLALIPKATQEKIPVLSMAYGLSAAAMGKSFPWVFNPPLTYWDGLSVAIKYVGDKTGGLDKLKGKTIGFIYLDAPYGKEPIPLLEGLAKDYGFKVAKYPVPADKMQDQSSQWLNVQQDNPDWMIMWGWGAMNPTAVKEAAKVGFPMDKFIGVWWSGSEDDARPAGPGGKGYLTLNFTATGADFPAVQDIVKHVFDKGNSSVKEKSKIGEVNYNKGVYNSVLMAEAIRTAQKITGKKAINAADMRLGLEALEISEARFKEIGLGGFAAPVKVTCEDHSGAHAVYLQQWNGTKWVKASDWITPMKDKVRPLLEKDASDYTTKNAPWPARSEECPKS